MKLKKMLESISELSNAERNVQLEQRKLLKSTLKQLRKKCRELEQDIDNETDVERRKELVEKLKIVSTQRAKGLVLLKDLQGSSKSD